MALQFDEPRMEKALSDLAEKQEPIKTTKTGLARVILWEAIRACEQADDPHAWKRDASIVRPKKR